MHVAVAESGSYMHEADESPNPLRSERGAATSGAGSLTRGAGYATFFAAVAERVQDGSVFVSSGQASERASQRSIRFEDSRDDRCNLFRIEGYHGAFQLVPEFGRERLNVLTPHGTGRIHNIVFGP